MSGPVRLQLSRKRGFNLQALSLATNGLLAVNVARPGPWGNPFVVGQAGTRLECVRFYDALIRDAGLLALTCNTSVGDQAAARHHVVNHWPELVGKNLACWCHGSPCHGEILLDVAQSMSRKRKAA